MAINPTSGYIFTSEYIWKGNEIIISKRNLYSHILCIYIHSSLETYYYRNNLSTCQQVKRLKQCDVIYICEFYLAIKEERNSSICDSMHEIGGPYANSCLENPWLEEPGRVQSIGSRRVGHD